jgi:hypothetical protein
MRNYTSNSKAGRTTLKRVAFITSIALLALSLGAVAGTAQTMSGGNYQITSSVQASGGGTSTGSGNKVIDGTAGQAAAGGSYTGSALSHEAGFWATTLPLPTASPTPTPTSLPGISINDVSQAEGNSGSTSFTFTISLSTASTQVVTVNYATADGIAIAGSDYQPASGVLIFSPGETSKLLTLWVNGDADVEPDERFFVNLSSPGNATLVRSQGTGRINNDDNSSSSTTVQFGQANYSVQEELGALTVTITRAGDPSSPVSVDYLTTDGSATQRADFEYAAGTVHFAPGETSRTVTILINEDAYIESGETFIVTLSNPAGAALGQQSTTTVAINDDLPETIVNPLDDSQQFVYMHYHDFLNREPDLAGLQFWTNQIETCGSDAQCREVKRINVSAAFFLSIEFQETGYLRYLLQKESFGSTTKYAEFMRDVQEVSNGVIVNSPGWEQKLKDNQVQFADQWVNRPAFKATYDAMSNTEFVNAIYAKAGILPSPVKRDSLVSALDANSQNRSSVLLEVAADAGFRQKEYSAAFVLMQYFGYLRRDPEATPDSDLSGYNFWLFKLNSFNGNYIDAEMVKAFITSIEYRQRFAQ